MSGQAIVTINEKQWQTYLAVTSSELTAGLSGLTTLAPGPGMLFILPGESGVTVTTQNMLFPLDIIFISGQYRVVEIARSVSPGRLVSLNVPVKYFLEVNAGEAGDLESGEPVEIRVSEIPITENWLSPAITLAGVLAVGAWLARMGRTMARAMLAKPEEKSLPSSPREERLLTQTRAGSQYVIRQDRLGNLIITRTDDPGKDVFLQFEADKELVYSLLKRGEKRALDAGWEVKIKRSEPRSSLLDELWEAAMPSREYPHEQKQARCSSRILKTVASTEENIFPSGTNESFEKIERENRKAWKQVKPGLIRPKLIPVHSDKTEASDKLEFLPDSSEFLAYTIDDIGYRDRIDSAFLQAIARAKRR